MALCCAATGTLPTKKSLSHVPVAQGGRAAAKHARGKERDRLGRGLRAGRSLDSGRRDRLLAGHPGDDGWEHQIPPCSE